MNLRDPQQVLARHLRALREEHWPGSRVTQAQLAQALGKASVPLISSWESVTSPKIPPVPRLEAYATFFATPRSIEGAQPRLLRLDELTDAERAARDELARELLHLRAGALGSTTPVLTPIQAEEEENIASLNSGYWRFADGRPITIVCAQLPASMLDEIPYSDPEDPDYVALYAYADLDAFIELHGHIRAANPGSQVNFRTAPNVVSDDYTTHLVLLGGVDWNYATESVFNKLALPVSQFADWDTPDGQYFEISGGGESSRFRPILSRGDDKKVLHEDVALFARAVNPFNRLRTVTICNGMYASGTYGAVRALTDKRFRDRNAQFARERFGEHKAFCILMRVQVERGVAVTPDWTLSENRLFEWVGES
jgi:hypothetical protein